MVKNTKLMKTCPACKTRKRRTLFGLRKNGYSRSRCRSCEAEMGRKYISARPGLRTEYNRVSTLKRGYGITVEQYLVVYADQKGRCKICGNHAPGNEWLHVDHDHDTLQIRGLLCNTCNRGIGLFRDNIEVLTRAIAYLEDKSSYPDLYSHK